MCMYTYICTHTFVAFECVLDPKNRNFERALFTECIAFITTCVYMCVLQCVAARCSVLNCVAVWCKALRCVAACFSISVFTSTPTCVQIWLNSILFIRLTLLFVILYLFTRMYTSYIFTALCHCRYYPACTLIKQYITTH